MLRILSGPLSVEQLRIEISGLSASLEQTRLVQLSDFHFDGFRLSPQMLLEAIAISNQFQPDLVVLTGDFVTDDPAPIRELVTYLQKLKSRAGVYAVLGNHDLYYAHSKTEISTALQQGGIQVLWNQIGLPLGPELPIVGLADFWSGEFDPAPIFANLDPQTPRIVLSHNPDSAADLTQWRVDLQLSGHTHGGQIVLPLIGPLPGWIEHFISQPLQRCCPGLKQGYRVIRRWEWAQGLHPIGTNQLYVNRGLGTYLPGRLFCPPEVTLITLVPQALKSFF